MKKTKLVKASALKNESQITSLIAQIANNLMKNLFFYGLLPACSSAILIIQYFQMLKNE